ncbi:CAAX amino terminal protease family [Candidatus Methanoperedens nitroreducens]|uniref:CAAX amino terminal protease family n=1 Tax=Candidatus Methanoperedens nitratireducens TaxID=1392998 RepID=A0A062V2A6_9EURY|nr:type II CAAX endopeptidase family protein [Candidatus Methanoperedens nitroreducens]KCZ71492.1 CAAX amino terminal protease family [Candidatus Methanoperedens nitroreducens]MDJ1421121.1 type II CAAX endopeptidase family protein [Candidatus Methanoperedens sp.]
MDNRDTTGIQASIAFYFILVLIVLVSAYIPGIAFIAYLFIIAVLYILKDMEGGFKWGTSWEPGFLFGFVLISLIFILELWLGWIKPGELYPNTFYLLIAYVIFQLLVALGEEMSFRGYILPKLINSLGIRNAVITTSILFSGLHIPSILSLDIGTFNALIMFITVSIAGILLALLYLAGGLKMSCGFHYSWNFFQYHVFSLRSGLGIFDITVTEPEFTGGPAGPEAGIMGLLALMIGTLIVWYVIVKNKYLNAIVKGIHYG